MPNRRCRSSHTSADTANLQKTSERKKKHTNERENHEKKNNNQLTNRNGNRIHSIQNIKSPTMAFTNGFISFFFIDHTNRNINILQAH